MRDPRKVAPSVLRARLPMLVVDRSFCVPLQGSCHESCYSGCNEKPSTFDRLPIYHYFKECKWSTAVVETEKHVSSGAYYFHFVSRSMNIPFFFHRNWIRDTCIFEESCKARCPPQDVHRLATGIMDISRYPLGILWLSVIRGPWVIRRPSAILQ